MKADSSARAAVLVGLGISMALLLSACVPPLVADTPPGSIVGEEPVDPGGIDVNVLPPSFPSEIPLFNEDIAFTEYREQESSWSVLLMTQNLNADFDSACTQLADAGFTQTFYSREGNDSLATFEGATYQIQLVGGENAEHGPVIDYFVYPLG